MVIAEEMLKKAWKDAKDPSDREHVTPYMKKYTKVSVDTQKDLTKVRKLWTGKIR